MTYGPNGFLQNAALWDDPPPDAGDPDYTCTDHYPITLEVENAVCSTDGGNTWQPLTIPTMPVYNTVADVQFRDDGYGLGWTGLVDLFNAQLQSKDMCLLPASGNRYVVEYKNGANETTHMFKLVWRWVVTGGNCEGALDPWHTQWTNEWQYTGSDGQKFQQGNGNSATSGMPLPESTADAPMEECQDL